jgi:adenosylhomocysteine nucleosidase
MAAAQWYSIRVAFSLGFAGGLVESLGIGDLVLPSVVQNDDGLSGHVLHTAPARTAVASALAAAGIAFHEGPLLSVNVPLRTPEAKRSVHQRTGAVAVDMEAAGVAVAAQHLGIPWLALKSVVDPVDEPLPEFLANCTTEQGELRWRNLVWSAAASAKRRRALGKLGRAAHQAALRLRRALEVACRPGCLDACEPVQ